MIVSINRFAQRADRNSPEIVKELRKMGAVVAIIGQPVDLMVSFNNRWLPIEIKDPQSPSAAMKRIQMQFVVKATAPIAVICDIDAAIAFVRDGESYAITLQEKIEIQKWLKDNPDEKKLALNTFWRLIGRM